MTDTRSESWPGSPAGVWAESSPSPGKRLDRPAPPPWYRFDEFTRHVSVPRGYVWMSVVMMFVGAWLMAYVVVLFAIPLPDDGPWYLKLAAGPIAPLMPWSGFVGAAGAAALVGHGVVKWVRGSASRVSDLRSLHHRAVSIGYVTHAYPTRFRVTAGDGYTPTALLVDSRLPEPVAARLYTAAMTWLGRIGMDTKADDDARSLFGSRDVVPLTEVFGPGAAGGWIMRLYVAFDEHWQLVIPEPEDGGQPTRDNTYAIRAPARHS